MHNVMVKHVQQSKLQSKSHMKINDRQAQAHTGESNLVQNIPPHPPPPKEKEKTAIIQPNILQHICVYSGTKTEHGKAKQFNVNKMAAHEQILTYCCPNLLQFNKETFIHGLKKQYTRVLKRKKESNI